MRADNVEPWHITLSGHQKRCPEHCLEQGPSIQRHIRIHQKPTGSSLKDEVLFVQHRARQQIRTDSRRNNTCHFCTPAPAIGCSRSCLAISSSFRWVCVCGIFQRRTAIDLQKRVHATISRCVMLSSLTASVRISFISVKAISACSNPSELARANSFLALPTSFRSELIIARWNVDSTCPLMRRSR